MKFTNKELYTILKSLELLKNKENSLLNEDAKTLIKRIKEESNLI